MLWWCFLSSALLSVCCKTIRLLPSWWHRGWEFDYHRSENEQFRAGHDSQCLCTYCVTKLWSTNSCCESIANDSSITAYSTHLSFVSDQQRQNSDTGLSKVPCKASVARQRLKQTGRDSVASRLHGRWVIPNVSLMNQLGFIRVDRRCSDTIRVLACSPAITCWVNISRPGGLYPWIPSLGPVNTNAITHATDARPFSLVLQISRNEWKGSACRKVLVETACWCDRPSLCRADCLPRDESLWLHAGKYDRLLIGHGSEATVTQRELRSVPHLVLVLWSNLKPSTTSPAPMTNFFLVIY